MTDKLADALRECEQACPCKAERKCGCGTKRAHCRCANPTGKLIHELDVLDHEDRVVDCRWPGHAAIRRYGDLREKAGYERGVEEGSVDGGYPENDCWCGEHNDRPRSSRR